jgi:hypothetical protein
MNKKFHLTLNTGTTPKPRLPASRFTFFVTNDLSSENKIYLPPIKPPKAILFRTIGGAIKAFATKGNLKESRTG